MAMTAGDAVTPVPVVRLGAGAVDVAAIVAGVIASSTEIVTAGVAAVAATTAGATVTPVPVVMVGAGTVVVQAIVAGAIESST